MTLSGLLSGLPRLPSFQTVESFKKMHRGCWLNSLIQHNLSMPSSHFTLVDVQTVPEATCQDAAPLPAAACSSLIPVPRGEPVSVGWTPHPRSRANSGSGWADGCYCTGIKAVCK